MKIRFLYNGKKIEMWGHEVPEYITTMISENQQFYETPLLEYLKPMKPKCFVDIGANIGNHSLFFHLNGTKEIHAFEPQEDNFKLLEKNCPFANVYNIALGDVNRMVSMTKFPQNMGACWVKEGKDVEMRTLDSFELKPDLIKIDVERLETKVLQGALKTLKKYSPRLIVEHGDLNDFYETYRLLEPLGYSVKLFSPKTWEVFEYVC